MNDITILTVQILPFPLSACTGSQALPFALRLRSESFPSSDFFKGPLLSDGPLLSGFNRKVKN